MIQLGSTIRDTQTGFVGIAVGCALWLNGCMRYGIQALELHDGKPIDVIWFDEQQVEIVKSNPPPVSENVTRAPGGPRQDPTR